MRYANGKKVTKYEARELENQARLESGEAVQMKHPDGRLRYFDNNKNEITKRQKQGFELVVYEEKVVKKVAGTEANATVEQPAAQDPEDAGTAKTSRSRRKKGE